MATLEERIGELEKWKWKMMAIATGLGVVALALGWTLADSNKRVATLRAQVDSANGTFEQVRLEQEEAFEAFVAGERESLVEDAAGLVIGSFLLTAPVFTELRRDITQLQQTELSAGAVVPFRALSCPAGWTEYPLAYGRFIRGIDKSDESIDPEGRRGLEDIQDDMLAQHSHRLVDVTSKNHGPQTQGIQGYASGPYGVPEPRTREVIGPNSGVETRPKNVALLYCVKS